MRDSPPAAYGAVAVINEVRCIGCTLCIGACPVDAIIGASGFMHTVIAVECTGCKLCIAPCPVDCIAMRETNGTLAPEQRKAAAAHARRRYRARNERLARESAARDACHAAVEEEAVEKKRNTVRRAIARARARLAERESGRSR